VFSNLIGNALKFTPAHGSVVVRLESHGDELRFLVSDTGEGIAARDLPRVFERFWQARPRQREGSGLGLSVAKEIVEAMGGRIWARSSLGAGSTFGFSLPIG
jgi:signal transduction histidine kinase